MSHALTLHRPLRVQELGPRRMAVDGTPVDCVKLALTGLLPAKPDLVVSGINKGPNLGDDIIYSGTVSAAIEGTLLGIPAIAVSLVTFENFDFRAAAEFTAQVDRAHPKARHSGGHPAQRQRAALTQRTTQGLEIYPHGQAPLQRNHRRTDRSARRQVLLDRRRRLGFANDDGTDCVAVHEGYVSVTPLQVDLTDHKLLKDTPVAQFPWP